MIPILLGVGTCAHAGSKWRGPVQVPRKLLIGTLDRFSFRIINQFPVQAVQSVRVVGPLTLGAGPLDSWLLGPWLMALSP